MLPLQLCAIALTSQKPATLSRLTKTRAMAFTDRKSTRLNSSHQIISYAVFCLKKKKTHLTASDRIRRNAGFGLVTRSSCRRSGPRSEALQGVLDDVQLGMSFWVSTTRHWSTPS